VCPRMKAQGKKGEVDNQGVGQGCLERALTRYWSNVLAVGQCSGSALGPSAEGCEEGAKGAKGVKGARLSALPHTSECPGSCLRAQELEGFRGPDEDAATSESVHSSRRVLFEVIEGLKVVPSASLLQ